MQADNDMRIVGLERDTGNQVGWKLSDQNPQE